MILVVLVFASSFVFAWVIRIACACVYAIAYVAGENQALRWRRVGRGTDLSFYLLVRVNLKSYMHGPLLFGWTNFDKRPLNQQRFSCTVVNLAGFLYIELRVRRAFCTIWPRRAKQRHFVRQDVGAVASSLQLSMVRFVPLTESCKRFIPLTKCQLVS